MSGPGLDCTVRVTKAQQFSVGTPRQHSCKDVRLPKEELQLSFCSCRQESAVLAERLLRSGEKRPSQVHALLVRSCTLYTGARPAQARSSHASRGTCQRT